MMGAQGRLALAVGQDDAVLALSSDHVGASADTATVQRVAHALMQPVVVLPATRLSGYRGYPLICWSEGVADRLRSGVGPMLDRPTLSLWESWPAGMDWAPPPTPLQIRGFISTASWHRALRAARELRGFGVTCVLSPTQPSAIKLAEADIAGVFVVRVAAGGDELLVQGRPAAAAAPRMVATRYWEERLWAHALQVGAVRPPQSTARP